MTLPARRKPTCCRGSRFFYEQQQVGIGDYFLDSLFADIDALSLYGGIHPKPDGRLHRTMAKRFPFAIYYILRDDIATVVAVLDCRQNPAVYCRSFAA